MKPMTNEQRQDANEFFASQFEKSEPAQWRSFEIEWQDGWGRTKSKTVWAESRWSALQKVNKKGATIIWPKLPEEL
jgi:hypothetical protein